MTLLPPNSTPTERAIEAATDRPIPLPVGDLWNPDRCPVDLLPWLAWALSIDDWDADWTEETKRAVIRAAVEIHRHKGTVWAMRRALAVAGLGDADIQEGWSANQFDGTLLFDGGQTFAQSDHWAEYRVTLTRPLAVRQADQARAILTGAAPVSRHIKRLDFTQAAHLYDGSIRFDGQYTHGAI